MNERIAAFEARLRRWVEGTSWQRASGDSRLRMPVTGYRCLRCGEWATSVAAIHHSPGCIVGDTLKMLKEMEASDDNATE